MTRYLVCTPDRYGRFGHQTNSIYSALFLARISGAKLILPRYMYFCDKWNKYVSWSESDFVATNLYCSNSQVFYLENPVACANGNRKFLASNKFQVNHIIELIHSYPDNSLIMLPFDQQISCSYSLLKSRSELNLELKKIFKFFDQNPITPSQKYLCIHIRRGDCTKTRFPNWYIDDSFYINLLHIIDKYLPSNIDIQVCTQGDVQWLTSVNFRHDRKLLVSSTMQDFINDSEVNDFLLMKNSSFLITCGSSFGHWAAILNKSPYKIDISRIVSPLSPNITINPDVSLSKIDEQMAYYLSRYENESSI